MIWTTRTAFTMKQRPTVRRRESSHVLRSVRALHSRVAAWRSRPSFVQLWRSVAEQAKREWYQTKYTSDSEDDDTACNANDSKKNHKSRDASRLEDNTSNEYTSTVESPNMDLCREDSNYCQIASSHPRETSLDKINFGASIGRQCCKTILDAIRTWEQHPAVRKLPKAHSILQENELVRVYSDWPTVTPKSGQKAAKCSMTFHHSEEWYSLRLFQPEGLPVSSLDIASVYTFPMTRLVVGGTYSLRSFQRLFQWLDECTTTHPACQKSDFSSGDDHVDKIAQYRLPKRILEIVGHCVALRENVVSKDSYVCLSHCWGSEGIQFKLERSTIGLLKGGIAISALPKTFRDAVLVCVRLGFRFIWIDALCIIQDSTEDWEEAVAVMADVYENGLFTIAATAAEDSNGGLFSDLGSPFSPKKLRDSVLHVAQAREHAEWGFGRAPLLSRAWVFQERSLSSRVIHFTEAQIIWECCSMLKSESGHLNYDWSNRPGDSRVESHFKMPIEDTTQSWHKTVATYSKLKLTYEKDRLPALAAIVKRMMQSRPNDEYIAGLWRKTFLEDLLWCTSSMVIVTPMRPDVHVPTWSWASVGIGVGYFNTVPIRSAALVDVKYKNAGPAQLGDVTDASIVLRGHSCTALVEGLRKLVLISRNKASILSHFYGQEFKADYDFLQEGSRQIKRGDTVAILFIGCSIQRIDVRWVSLVLKEFTPGLHERIGYFTMYIGHPSRGLEESLDFRLNQHFVLSQPIRTFTIV